MKKFWHFANILFLLLTIFIITNCSDNTIDPNPDPGNNIDPELANKTKILFIGNSYTGYHDMPGMFEQICLSSGKDVFVDRSITYNKRLPYFLHDSLTLAKINSLPWDYVIFPQAQFITDAEDRLWQHIDVSLELESIIHTNNPETKIVLFMEQAYAVGDHTYSPDDTFLKMTERVIAGSLKWAEQMHNPTIAPVAAAWADVYNAFPRWDEKNLLHESDGAHPTKYGAYITACTFYATMFKETVSSDYNPEISDRFCDEVKSIASHTVISDFEKWHIE